MGRESHYGGRTAGMYVKQRKVIIADTYFKVNEITCANHLEFETIDDADAW